ncbi:MAG: MerR family transcriptional regulator [Provencibacterium sp.]|jgi:DNA-binding transcriptional MerR regulator|nr:MerR family transcriptional regulator [Provencibacterium sp.]
MRTVREVSRLAKVSVRTLHYYDAIGLLKPTQVTGAGYRLYDDAALRRLQSILLFRELQFPLKEIRAILDSPHFEPEKALSQQIKLLELQYRHIGELIALARKIQKEGVGFMGFEAFDKTELERYKAETRQRWGTTAAYAEYEQRAQQQGEADQQEISCRLMARFAEMGRLSQQQPESAAAQEKVAALQRFITENCYTCTDEILKGLGEMYTADPRMRDSIDRAGGEGTAAFVSQAIAVYCRSRFKSTGIN